MDVPLPAAAPADTASCDPSGDRPGGCTCCAGIARAQTERQLQKLRRLSDIGVNLADAIERQTADANWLGGDGALMFARIARAVRQTVALEIKIDADSRMSEPQRAAEQARREAAPQRDRQSRPEDRPEELVERPDAVEAGTGAEADGAGNLLCDLRERLEDPDIEDELAGRPIGVIVAAICQDLGVPGDLSAFSETVTGLVCPPADAVGDALPKPPVAGPSGAVDSGGPPAPRPARVATGHDPP